MGLQRRPLRKASGILSSGNDMRASPLESDTPAKIVPLTVDQYHRMIEAAILPEGEPIELIDGLLVRKDRSAVGADPMTVGHAHRPGRDTIAQPGRAASPLQTSYLRSEPDRPAAHARTRT